MGFLSELFFGDDDENERSKTIEDILCPKNWEYLDEDELAEAIDDGELDWDKLLKYVGAGKTSKAAKLIWDAGFCEDEPISDVIAIEAPDSDGDMVAIVFVEQNEDDSDEED